MNLIEVQVSDLITDTQDRLGPGCDEDALAQALVEKFDIRPLRASPAEGEAVAWRWHYKLEPNRWFYQPFKPDLSKLIIKWETELEPLYTAPPRAAVSPPQREEVEAAIHRLRASFVDDEVYDFTDCDPAEDVKHLLAAYDRAVLALYPAGDGRDADSLSGEKGKSE